MELDNTAKRKFNEMLREVEGTTSKMFRLDPSDLENEKPWAKSRDFHKSKVKLCS